MTDQNHRLIALLACALLALINSGIATTARASQMNDTDKAGVAAGMIYGKVTDVIESAGYTYAEVDTGKTKVWAATTTTAIKVGDMISFAASMPMQKYYSKSLKREFPLVYFTNSFDTATAGMKHTATAAASPHEQITHHLQTRPIKEFDKAEGGNTIAELYADKDNLNGKTVHVRGQVTRVTNSVMGRNWLHISDSSTRDDLTVTTSNTAAMDDIVVIEGRLSLDKDYNYGYVYPLIVEDATVVKE